VEWWSAVHFWSVLTLCYLPASVLGGRLPPFWATCMHFYLFWAVDAGACISGSCSFLIPFLRLFSVHFSKAGGIVHFVFWRLFLSGLECSTCHHTCILFSSAFVVLGAGCLWVGGWVGA